MDKRNRYRNHWSLFSGPLYFLSNFYPCSITMPDGITYQCAEAAFQAQKCADLDERRQFSLMNGSIAKKCGRTVDLRPGWNQMRIDVMREVIHAKFTQNPKLARWLVETKNELVEKNTWGDRFWGVDFYNGVGENHLGRILMEEREKLRQDPLTADDTYGW